ncbi:MAG: DUF2461 domain-containing protein [Campylobacterota bacterium]|nr:DUF2461 domain-containing protein [Campylobacterota bacterium]
MSFVCFSKESLNFLERIRKNNTKEWFEAHRSEYEALILQPSREAATEIGEHLQALEPTVNAIPKINGSLFRIYRDIRFSKDKTPIKSRIGLIFWQGSGKRMQSSSFYLHFSPDELFVAVGIRGFSSETLVIYREYIKNREHCKNLHVILEDMKSKGFLLPEPKYKRLPRGFEKNMEFEELAKFASMFTYKTFSAKAIHSKELIHTLYETYEAMFPLQQWVYEMTLHNQDL